MTEEQEKELKAKHPRFVRVTIAGKVLAFKPLNKAKVQQIKADLGKSPELAVELLCNACKFQCIFGKDDFDALADLYPLAFTGGDKDEPGVINALYDMARGGVQIETV